MVHKYFVVWFVYCFSILFSVNVSAQDANYWTFQYGSRSTLLGGAVIGSVLDLSGTYYNPGAVSLVRDPETVLAAKVVDYSIYRMKGSFIDDIEIAHSNLGPAPSLVATNLKFEWLGENNIILSILTRYDLNFDLHYGTNSQFDLENVKDVITNLRINEKLNESWFGITWSYNYDSKVGIGFTPYFVFRSHTTFINTNFQAISPDNDLFQVIDNREYEYSHYSVLLKAGVTFDFIGHTFGLTLTTPRLGYYKNGSSGVNRTVKGISPIEEGEELQYVAADYQRDVGADYISPLSIAVGTTFKIEETNIYVSAEWFSPVGRYEVIKPQIYHPQIGSDTLNNGVVSEAKSVLNVGIGVQYTFDNSNTLNASFRTDFSASIPNSDNNLSLASWDIYHLMLGGSFNALDLELTLGLGYAFGIEQVQKLSGGSALALNSSIIDPFDGAKFSYQSFKFIFGFAF